MAAALRRRAGVFGEPRAFGRVFTVGLLTFGVAWAAYYFRAFREVDVQEGKRHSSLFFLAFIPLLGILFASAYVARELRVLRQARRSVGLDPGLSAGQHFLWAWLGLPIVVGPAVALALLVDSINGYWAEVYRQHGLPWPENVPRPRPWPLPRRRPPAANPSA